MRTRISLGLVALGAAALVAGTSVPASAAAGDTVTTFSLAGGSLSVSVQPTAALANGNSGSTSISGQLGAVQVTDNRGGTTPWSAAATSTKFTTGTGNPESTGVTYNAGTITTTGIVVMPLATNRSLNATPTQVVGPTVITGNNTASWNPTLTVTLPASALTGDYTGTVNTSVS